MAYEASKYEDDIYKKWESSGAFQPKIKQFKRPFTIMMPPPNATGTLHLGHAIMLAIEDAMARFHRMKGDVALWLPGTDHAAIATQNRVEKELEKEGLSRNDLGREKFLERAHAFVKNSQNTIRNQIRKMGSSCDWSRERYTFDPGLSEAVQEIFVRMYGDGLIYRGDRIVNWCPRCQSTLADDEVEYKQVKTKFYYFQYGPVIIGTARPETKFLDKTIVVHPDDPRYTHLHGKEFGVEWIGGSVRANVIADRIVDPKFGTGAMTITPAHSFEDFDLAKKYGLPIVKIIDEQGNFTSAAGTFVGKNARESRDEIVEMLQQKGLVEKIDENYRHNLSVCYRCDTPIEPLTSKQWFVDVNKKFRRGKSLKDMAIDVVKKEKIKILPERFKKIYFHWMENLRDWCISRQIWFGHRIPVFYCVGGGKCEGGICKMPCRDPIVAKEPPKKCPHCGSENFEQDKDTLDTWFSSGLWTFSTLGWPKKTRDLKYFHPTSVLETGYDILFFWIARMILMSAYALDTVPFRTVYLHGLVRTRNGEKMSKSKPETCIDPLDMIGKYGADALRLSMMIGSAPGNDLRLYEEKIAGYRNFVNKLWNAARFTSLQLTADSFQLAEGGLSKRDLKSRADKWIVTELHRLIKEVTAHMEKYEFSEAGTKIYDFTWGKYCDWYLEISKSEHFKNPSVLRYTQRTLLLLLHPFIPFVTETLWKDLGNETLLMTEKWPKFDKRLMYPKEAHEMEIVHSVITSIRRLRELSRLDPKIMLGAFIVVKKHKKLFEEKREIIMRLARLATVTTTEEPPKIAHALRIVLPEATVIIPAEGLVDIEGERKRLQALLNEKVSYTATLRKKLSSESFTTHAPLEVIEAERERLARITYEAEELRAHLEAL